jgi:uncharacterized membrane protein YfcA
MDSKYLIIIIIGLLCGMIESTIGVACMIIPLLLFTEVFFDYKKALGTTLCAFIIPLSIGAVYIHYQNDNIKFDYAIMLAIAYFIGATISAKYIVHKFNNNDLTLGAGITLLVMSCYYLNKYYCDSKNDIET